MFYSVRKMSVYSVRNMSVYSVRMMSVYSVRKMFYSVRKMRGRRCCRQVR